MSYKKELLYNDYTIEFEYDYNRENLYLSSWTAYVGDNEVDVPCVIESEFIQCQLEKWLDMEWSHNSFNYVEDYEISRAMRKCEF